MDATSQQIIRNLEDKREKLNDNLNELQDKVREAADWRTYYTRNPWPILGAALVGGLLLASIFPGSRRG